MATSPRDATMPAPAHRLASTEGKGGMDTLDAPKPLDRGTPQPRFFHYRDENGQDVVVDSLELVPVDQRAHAREINANTQPVPPARVVPPSSSPCSSSSESASTASSTGTPGFAEFTAARQGPMVLHLPSVLLGVLLSAVSLLVMQLIRGVRGRHALTLTMVVVVGALGVLGYVSVLRYQLENVQQLQHQLLRQQKASPLPNPSGMDP